MKIAEARFTVWDTETTGFDPATDAVCEVACVVVGPCALLEEGGASHASRSSWSSLVNPERPIPPSASAVHHLTAEDVAGAPRLDYLLANALRPALSGAFVPVAHSADFDSKFLPQVPGPWLCTHRLAKHLWPEFESHGNQFLRYQLQRRPAIAKDTPSHRALADAIVTADLLVAMLAEVPRRWPGVTTTEELIAETVKPCLLHIVPFKSAGGVTFADAETSLLQWIINKQAGGEDVIYTAGQELKRRFGGGQRRLIDDEGDDENENY